MIWSKNWAIRSTESRIEWSRRRQRSWTPAHSRSSKRTQGWTSHKSSLPSSQPSLNLHKWSTRSKTSWSLWRLWRRHIRAHMPRKRILRSRCLDATQTQPTHPARASASQIATTSINQRATEEERMRWTSPSWLRSWSNKNSSSQTARNKPNPFFPTIGSDWPIWFQETALWSLQRSRRLHSQIATNRCIWTWSMSTVNHRTERPVALQRHLQALPNPSQLGAELMRWLSPQAKARLALQETSSPRKMWRTKSDTPRRAIRRTHRAALRLQCFPSTLIRVSQATKNTAW